MRNSFRGLLALTEAILRQEPTSGHLFVFVNKRRDMMKILHWDGSGFWIWYRRLERGTFQFPPMLAAPSPLRPSPRLHRHRTRIRSAI